MSLRPAGERNHLQAEINVTPLADIMIVLLIIFMVATPVIARHDVSLPPAAYAREGPTARGVKLLIRLDTAVELDGRLISSRDELLSALARRLGPGEASFVGVEADEGLPFAEVARALELCRQVGVEEVRLAASARPIR